VDLVDFADVYSVTFAGPPPDSLIARLRRAPGLCVARIPRPSEAGFPNDPLYGEQWHLNNTGQTYDGEPCIPDLDIDADSAWAIATGPGTKIAFVDTGIDPAHDDLTPSIDQDRSFGFGLNTSWWEREDCILGDLSHGTCVAGIPLARGDNSTGVASVANTPVGGTPYPIVALNVMDFPCRSINPAATVQALAHVASEGIYPSILITNNSWVSEYCFWSQNEDYRYPFELRDAVRNLYLLDVSTFACGGNRVTPACAGSIPPPCGRSRCWNFPAAFTDYCLGVRGITCTGGEPLPFGASQPSRFWIDVTTPSRVTTTVNAAGSFYTMFQGCSAATPVAAGAAALLLSKAPDLTNEDIYGLIQSTCKDLGPVGWDSTYGAGLVKADDALRLLDPPYRLFHRAAHEFISEDLGMHPQWFMNVDGLNSAGDVWEPFQARLYRLRIPAPFPGTGFTPDPVRGVWGRGIGSMGARDLDSLDAHFWAPYVRVDSSTITPLGCTLETYTYKVYDAAGRVFKCWYPVAIGSGQVCGSTQGVATFLYSYVADTTGAARMVLPGPPPAEDGEEQQRPDGSLLAVFETRRPCIGTVVVHSVFGREVRSLAREIYLSRGVHRYVWDGRDSAGRRVPSGVYFISLRSELGKTVRRVRVLH
jgi:hypothetical protein